MTSDLGVKRGAGGCNHREIGGALSIMAYSLDIRVV